MSSLGYSTYRGQISVNETVWLLRIIREISTHVFSFEKWESVSFCASLPGWLSGICYIVQAGLEFMTTLCIAQAGLEFTTFPLAQSSEHWLEPSLTSS